MPGKRHRPASTTEFPKGHSNRVFTWTGLLHKKTSFSELQGGAGIHPTAFPKCDLSILITLQRRLSGSQHSHRIIPNSPESEENGALPSSYL